MNDKAARKLKVGDRIRWDALGGQAIGTINKTSFQACEVVWDDGHEPTIWHHGDMQDVQRLEERYDVTKAIA